MRILTTVVVFGLSFMLFSCSSEKVCPVCKKEKEPKKPEKEKVIPVADNSKKIEKSEDKFDSEAVKKFVSDGVIGVIERDLDSKSELCGRMGLSRNKRSHLAKLLKKASVWISPNPWKKMQDKVVNYKVEANIIFPPFKTKESGTELSTKPYTVTVEINCSKPPEANGNYVFGVKKIDVYSDRSVERSFCNNIFMSENKLAYSEQSATSK